jgi:hypothetical protein
MDAVAHVGGQPRGDGSGGDTLCFWALRLARLAAGGCSTTTASASSPPSCPAASSGAPSHQSSFSWSAIAAPAGKCRHSWITHQPTGPGPACPWITHQSTRPGHRALGLAPQPLPGTLPRRVAPAAGGSTHSASPTRLPTRALPDLPRACTRPLPTWPPSQSQGLARSSSSSSSSSSVSRMTFPPLTARTVPSPLHTAQSPQEAREGLQLGRQPRLRGPAAA